MKYIGNIGSVRILLSIVCTCIVFILQSKATAKVSEKSRNNCRSNSFQWCPLLHLCLYCYCTYTCIRYQKSFIRSM